MVMIAAHLLTVFYGGPDSLIREQICRESLDTIDRLEKLRDDPEVLFPARELGTYKTVTARFWPWLSGESSYNL